MARKKRKSRYRKTHKLEVTLRLGEDYKNVIIETVKGLHHNRSSTLPHTAFVPRGTLLQQRITVDLGGGKSRIVIVVPKRRIKQGQIELRL